MWLTSTKCLISTSLLCSQSTPNFLHPMRYLWQTYLPRCTWMSRLLLLLPLFPWCYYAPVLTKMMSKCRSLSLSLRQYALRVWWTWRKMPKRSRKITRNCCRKSRLPRKVRHLPCPHLTFSTSMASPLRGWQKKKFKRRWKKKNRRQSVEWRNLRLFRSFSVCKTWNKRT